MDSFDDMVDSAASTIKKAAKNASSTAGKISDKAGKAASSISSTVADTASGVATSVSKAASCAASSINDDIAERRRQKAEIESELLREEEGKRKERIAKIEDPRTLKFLEMLGESPIPTLPGNIEKIKRAFPVPVEQDILWADAEFDLRPSGIIATNKGMFIKSDAVAFSLPFAKNEDKETCSKLHYIPWEYFEPECFTKEDDGNYALAVDEECSLRFIKACQYLALVENVSEESYDVEAAYEVHGGIHGVEGAAAALFAGNDRMNFIENHAHVKNPGGHGEFAEKANNALDRIFGRDATVVGEDRKKNGPDRRIDFNGTSLLIQTKYYKSARGTLEAAFDAKTGLYRYIDSETSQLMQLEVPRDQYDRVVEGFKKKIEQGKVPGVSDPAEAEQLVRKGFLTYDQAVNLAKPGTVESLIYDAASGAVTSTCAFGITFVASAFNAYRQTHDAEKSIQAGITAGVQVFGVSFLQNVLISQVLRTGAADALMAPSQFLVEKLGYKATQELVNAIRALSGQSALGGAAAAKHLAKLFRNNVVTTSITLAVCSVPETYRLANKRITGAQYVKNMAGITGSVLGGAGGAVAAGAAAGKVAAVAGTAVTPGVGTAVGFVGGFVGGAAAAAAVDTIGGIIYEGDDVVISRLFNAYVASMALEYLFDDEEIEALTKSLSKITNNEFKKLFGDFLKSSDQEAVLRDFLTPLFDDIAAKRKRFDLPFAEIIGGAFTEMLIFEN